MGMTYANFLHKAHQDVLTVEILSQDVDVLAEMIVFHAHRAIQNMMWNIFAMNGAEIIYTEDLSFLLRQAVNNKWMCVDDDEMRCAVVLSQYASAVLYTDTSNIERSEALNAIMICNRLADAIEYNGFQSFKINSSEDIDVPYFKSPRRINLSPIILNKIAESIASTVPTKVIYIFGSYARREEHKNSDIDIYVVTKNNTNNSGLNISDMSEVRKALFWLKKPKDIFCVSEKYFDECSKNPKGIEQSVIQEGIKIYEQ